MAYTGVIHTASSYVLELPVNISNGGKIREDLYDSAYNYLKQEELKFYHQFFSDVNTIEDFIAKIREQFQKAANDREIFKQFSNANLNQYIPNQELPFFEQGYKITFVGCSETIDCNQGNMSGSFTINVTPDNLSQIQNELNNRLNRNSRTAFRSQDVTSELINTLKQGLSGGNLQKVFKISGGKTSTGTQQKTFDVKAFSKWTKDQLKDIRTNNTPEGKRYAAQVRQEVRKALNMMHQFLFSNYGNASNEMKQAMNSAWREVNPVGNDILANDFFFEGTNYTKVLKGQVGEFSNKVLIKYLELIKTTNSSPKLVQIIGSIFKGGQEPRSDLQIMLDCNANINFQTKNIKDTTTVTTNTTADLIAKNFDSNIIDPLVNYYANATYGSSQAGLLDKLEEMLSTRYFEAMNLNINEGLNEFQTNTFYFVGGGNIIPASRIIEQLKLNYQMHPPKFTISGGNVESYTDSEYGAGDPPTYVSLEYWKYPKGKNSGQLEPGPKNAPAFQKAASSISISTSFSVNALIKSGTFDIFG